MNGVVGNPVRALRRGLWVACVGAMGLAQATNVFIGSVEPGHVTPAAAVPFGMVQAGPDTSPTAAKFEPGKAHTGGYDYRDGWLWRFSQMHVSGTGCCAFGDFALLPYVAGFDGTTRPAKMLKETEKGEPGLYAVTLAEDGTRIEAAVSALAKSAVYRFRYPAGASAKVLFDVDWGLNDPDPNGCFGRKVYWSECRFTSPVTFAGGRRVRMWNDYTAYFAVRTSVPVRARRQVRAADGLRGDIWELDFGPLADGVLELRLGLSFTSPEKAASNLAAGVETLSFETVRARAAAAWAAQLDRCTLDPATPRDVAENFSAALYRLALQPNDLADENAAPAYSTLSLWDTFRAAHPLYTILAPERVPGMVNSMLDQYDRQGYLPIWALGGRDNHCMIGHHAVPVVADACLKGFPGIDSARAFAAVKDSLTRNHPPDGDGTWGLMKEDWDILDEYGYYPFDRMRGGFRGQRVKGESVARTLECAYDDACAARLARLVGKAEEAAFFAKRAGNWRNVFDPAVGFMRGKDAAGHWREPFNPWALGAGPWRANDFCEGNSWQYTWHVMQDPQGLIDAMGGRAPFVAKLESLFTARPLGQEDGESYDVSGLIGQYTHGNEPSHHVIYFFTLAERPDLTAKWVHDVCRTQYKPIPEGLTGNDDCGQMAAWYVFSALGFYPFDPCGGDYVLGAPQVPGATLHLPGARTFTVKAENFAPDNIYVRAVRLVSAGQVFDKTQSRLLTQAEIMRGGELVFEMCADPVR